MENKTTVFATADLPCGKSKTALTCADYVKCTVRTCPYSDNCFQIRDNAQHACFNSEEFKYLPHLVDDEDTLCYDCIHSTDCQFEYDKILEEKQELCYRCGGDRDCRAELEENLYFNCNDMDCPYASDCDYKKEQAEEDARWGHESLSNWERNNGWY